MGIQDERPQKRARVYMASSPQSLSVACIGLGKMGSGIAANVQKSGCRVTVYNRTAEKAQPLVVAGATLARTPREAAATAEFVVTNLMDDASVLGIVEGPDGVLAGFVLGEDPAVAMSMNVSMLIINELSEWLPFGTHSFRNQNISIQPI